MSRRQSNDFDNISESAAQIIPEDHDDDDYYYRENQGRKTSSFNRKNNISNSSKQAKRGTSNSNANNNNNNTRFSSGNTNRGSITALGNIGYDHLGQKKTWENKTKEQEEAEDHAYINEMIDEGEVNEAQILAAMPKFNFKRTPNNNGDPNTSSFANNNNNSSKNNENENNNNNNNSSEGPSGNDIFMIIGTFCHHFLPWYMLVMSMLRPCILSTPLAVLFVLLVRSATLITDKTKGTIQMLQLSVPLCYLSFLSFVVAGLVFVISHIINSTDTTGSRLLNHLVSNWNSDTLSVALWSGLFFIGAIMSLLPAFCDLTTSIGNSNNNNNNNSPAVLNNKNLVALSSNKNNSDNTIIASPATPVVSPASPNVDNKNNKNDRNKHIGATDDEFLWPVQASPLFVACIILRVADPIWVLFCVGVSVSFLLGSLVGTLILLVAMISFVSSVTFLRKKSLFDEYNKNKAKMSSTRNSNNNNNVRQSSSGNNHNNNNNNNNIHDDSYRLFGSNSNNQNNNNNSNDEELDEHQQMMIVLNSSRLRLRWRIRTAYLILFGLVVSFTILSTEIIRWALYPHDHTSSINTNYPNFAPHLLLLILRSKDSLLVPLYVCAAFGYYLCSVWYLTENPEILSSSTATTANLNNAANFNNNSGNGEMDENPYDAYSIVISTSSNNNNNKPDDAKTSLLVAQQNNSNTTGYGAVASSATVVTSGDDSNNNKEKTVKFLPSEKDTQSPQKSPQNNNMNNNKQSPPSPSSLKPQTPIAAPAQARGFASLLRTVFYRFLTSLFSIWNAVVLFFLLVVSFSVFSICWVCLWLAATLAPPSKSLSTFIAFFASIHLVVLHVQQLDGVGPPVWRIFSTGAGASSVIDSHDGSRTDVVGRTQPWTVVLLMIVVISNTAWALQFAEVQLKQYLMNQSLENRRRRREAARLKREAEQREAEQEENEESIQRKKRRELRRLRKEGVQDVGESTALLSTASTVEVALKKNGNDDDEGDANVEHNNKRNTREYSSSDEEEEEEEEENDDDDDEMLSPTADDADFLFQTGAHLDEKSKKRQSQIDRQKKRNAKKRSREAAAAENQEQQQQQQQNDTNNNNNDNADQDADAEQEAEDVAILSGTRRAAVKVLDTFDSTIQLALSICRRYFYVISFVLLLIILFRVLAIHVLLMFLSAAILLVRAQYKLLWTLLSYYSAALAMSLYCVNLFAPADSSLSSWGFYTQDNPWLLWFHFLCCASFLMQYTMMEADFEKNKNKILRLRSINTNDPSHRNSLNDKNKKKNANESTSLLAVEDSSATNYRKHDSEDTKLNLSGHWKFEKMNLKNNNNNNQNNKKNNNHNNDDDEQNWSWVSYIPIIERTCAGGFCVSNLALLAVNLGAHEANAVGLTFLLAFLCLTTCIMYTSATRPPRFVRTLWTFVTVFLVLLVTLVYLFQVWPHDWQTSFENSLPQGFTLELIGIAQYIQTRSLVPLLLPLASVMMLAVQSRAWMEVSTTNVDAAEEALAGTFLGSLITWAGHFVDLIKSFAVPIAILTLIVASSFDVNPVTSVYAIALLIMAISRVCRETKWLWRIVQVYSGLAAFAIYAVQLMRFHLNSAEMIQLSEYLGVPFEFRGDILAPRESTHLAVFVVAAFCAAPEYNIFGAHHQKYVADPNHETSAPPSHRSAEEMNRTAPPSTNDLESQNNARLQQQDQNSGHSNQTTQNRFHETMVSQLLHKEQRKNTPVAFFSRVLSNPLRYYRRLGFHITMLLLIGATWLQRSNVAGLLYLTVLIIIGSVGRRHMSVGIKTNALIAVLVCFVIMEYVTLIGLPPNPSSYVSRQNNNKNLTGTYSTSSLDDYLDLVASPSSSSSSSKMNVNNHKHNNNNINVDTGAESTTTSTMNPASTTTTTTTTHPTTTTTPAPGTANSQDFSLKDSDYFQIGTHVSLLCALLLLASACLTRAANISVGAHAFWGFAEPTSLSVGERTIRFREKINIARRTFASHWMHRLIPIPADREDFTQDASLSKSWWNRVKLRIYVSLPVVILILTFSYCIYDATDRLSIAKLLLLAISLWFLQFSQELLWKGNHWWNWMLRLHILLEVMRLIYLVPFDFPSGESFDLVRSAAGQQKDANANADSSMPATLATQYGPFWDYPVTDAAFHFVILMLLWLQASCFERVEYAFVLHYLFRMSQLGDSAAQILSRRRLEAFVGNKRSHYGEWERLLQKITTLERLNVEQQQQFKTEIFFQQQQEQYASSLLYPHRQYTGNFVNQPQNHHHHHHHDHHKRTHSQLSRATGGEVTPGKVSIFNNKNNQQQHNRVVSSASTSSQQKQENEHVYMAALEENQIQEQENSDSTLLVNIPPPIVISNSDHPADVADKNLALSSSTKPSVSIRMRILLWFHRRSIFDETTWNEVKRLADGHDSDADEEEEEEEGDEDHDDDDDEHKHEQNQKEKEVSQHHFLAIPKRNTVSSEDKKSSKNSSALIAPPLKLRKKQSSIMTNATSNTILVSELEEAESASTSTRNHHNNNNSKNNNHNHSNVNSHDGDDEVRDADSDSSASNQNKNKHHGNNNNHNKSNPHQRCHRRRCRRNKKDKPEDQVASSIPSAILYLISSHLDFLCYMAFCVNFALSPCILNAVLPIVSFSYAAAMTPRPHYMFWNLSLFYLQLVIISKSLVKVFGCDDSQNSPWTGRICMSGSYFVTDLFLSLGCVVAMLLHKANLVAWGLWNDAELDLKQTRIGIEKYEEESNAKQETGEYEPVGEFDEEKKEGRKQEPEIKNDDDDKGDNNNDPQQKQGYPASPQTKLTTTSTTTVISRKGKTDSTLSNNNNLAGNALSPASTTGAVVSGFRPQNYGQPVTVEGISENAKKFANDCVDNLFTSDTKFAMSDPYSPSVAAELLSIIILFFGYFRLMGEEDSIVSSLSGSLLPGTLTICVLVLFIVIVIDRIVYLRRNLRLKYALTVVSVFSYSVVLLVWFDRQSSFDSTYYGESPFWLRGALPLAAALFLLKMLYCFLGCRQIANGLPEYESHICFTGTCSLAEQIRYLLSRITPFAFDLRVLLDWTVTTTNLKMNQWIRMEDIAHELYMTKCDIDDTKDIQGMKTDPSKDPFPKWFKYLIGSIVFSIVALILLGPLLLYSSVSPVVQSNSVSEISAVVSLPNLPPLWQTQQAVDGSDLNSTLITLLEKTRPALLSSDFSQNTVQFLQLTKFSSSLWTISNQAIAEITARLSHGMSIALTLDISILSRSSREAGSSLGASQILSQTRMLSPDELDGFIAVTNGTTDSITITNMFHPFLSNRGTQFTVTASSNSITCTFIRHDDPGTGGGGGGSNNNNNYNNGSYSGITTSLFEISCNTLFILSNPTTYVPYNNLTESEFRCLQDTVNFRCPNEQLSDGGNVSSDGLFFVVESSQSLSVGFLQTIGIVAAYTTFVLAIGRVLRFIFSGMAFKVSIEAMENPEPLIDAVQLMYMARARHEYVVEFRAYNCLVDALRQTEFLQRVTKNQ